MGASANTVHFRNFLGVPGSALCGTERVLEHALTLNPAAVTCEHCLGRLGRLREANIAPPSDKKPRDR